MGPALIVRLPNLLYLADFPPSHLAGGAILMSRLLSEYPTEQVTVLAGSHYTEVSPREGRLACPHLVFPETNKTGPLGIGRLKVFADYLLSLILLGVVLRVVFRRSIQVILSVAHGHFFLVAAIISQLTGRPLILIVHDDWVSMTCRGLIPWKWPYHRVYRWALHCADHVYAISPFMQEFLERRYGIQAELQLPAAMPLNEIPRPVSDLSTERPFRIAYFGSILGTTTDVLDLLMRTLQGRYLECHGIAGWELHLYTNLSIPERTRWDHRWKDPRIHIHGWIPESQLRDALASIHLLFLPFSFDKSQEEFARTSLPTKTVDYLTFHKPVLVFAPSYSSLARYARMYQFAEVVDRPIPEALAEGIARIERSKDHREELCDHAKKVLKLNHNLLDQRDCFYQKASRIAFRRA